MPASRRTRSIVPTLVLSVVGPEGAGKTRFWTTARKPIDCLSTDTNTEHTVRNILQLDEDDVRLHYVPLPSMVFDDRDDVQTEAEEKREAILDYLRPRLKNKADRPRTLVFDTADDVNDLLILGVFGKLDQIPPETRRNMMGKVNTQYKGIIGAFKDAKVDVILVHRAKEKWVDQVIRTTRGPEDQRTRLTGPFDMERGGFKGTGFITNAEVFLAFDPNRPVKESVAEEAALAARYGMKIVRTTQRPIVIGKEYWGRQKLDDGSRIAKASIPFLMTQLHPETTIEDWQ